MSIIGKIQFSLKYRCFRKILFGNKPNSIKDQNNRCIICFVSKLGISQKNVIFKTCLDNPLSYLILTETTFKSTSAFAI